MKVELSRDQASILMLDIWKDYVDDIGSLMTFDSWLLVRYGVSPTYDFSVEPHKTYLEGSEEAVVWMLLNL